MGYRRLRGVAAGVAFAVVVIVAITAIAMMKVMDTFAASYRALADYSMSLQKPSFEIVSIDDNPDGSVNFTVVNRGPSAAYVHNIYVYKYTGGTVPSDVDVIDVRRYVPVGETLSFTLSSDKLVDYVLYGRPIRFTVNTDKGFTMVGTKLSGATLTVSINGPISYNVNFNPTVSVKCPANNPVLQRSYTLASSTSGSDYQVYVDPSRNNRLLVAKIPGIGVCRVDLSLAGLRLRALEGPFDTASSNNTVAGASVNEPTIPFETALAKLSPGGSASVEFTIPDVITKNAIKVVNNNTFYMLDFSWYFTGVLRYGEWEGLFSTVKGVYSDVPANYLGAVWVVDRIVKTRVAFAESPLGCKVDYLPYFMLWDWSSSGIIEDQRKFWSMPTGIAFRISTEEGKRCITSTNYFLNVSVRLKLQQGDYLVIPVIAYNDIDGPNNFPTTLSMFITPPGKSDNDIIMPVSEYSDRAILDFPLEQREGPDQIAHAFLLKANTTGDYYLRILIRTTNPAARNSLTYEQCFLCGPSTQLKEFQEGIYVVVSKVIVIPIDNATALPPPGGGGNQGGGGGGQQQQCRIKVLVQASGQYSYAYGKWVPVPIYQNNQLWSCLTNPNNVYVTDLNNNPMQYAVWLETSLRYGVVWIYVSNLMTNFAGEFYIYAGTSNPYTSYRVNPDWQWVQVPRNQNPNYVGTLQSWPWSVKSQYYSGTSIYRQELYAGYMYTETDQWNRNYYSLTIYYPVLETPLAVRGFYVAINELRTATDYGITFRVVGDSNNYLLIVKTCLYAGPEVIFYRGNQQLWSYETGCRYWGGWQYAGYKVSSAPDPGSVVFVPSSFINAPITYLEIKPLGGDYGRSYLYVYLYVPVNLPIAQLPGVSVSIV